MDNSINGTFVYRGKPDGLRRCLAALKGRGPEDSPLEVNDNVKTAIVPVGSVDTLPTTAYPFGSSAIPAASTPASGTYPLTTASIGYRHREYGRNPQSLGDWLFVAYAMPFALWDALMDGAKGRFSGR